MKRLVLTLLAALCCLGASAQFDARCIWEGGHCAFPSIEKFQGRYYVTFRQGEGHIFDKQGRAAGRVRVLSSADGENWESVAVLAKEGFDLRDPKLSVTPDGRLMLVIGGSVYEGKTLVQRIPHVSFSTDGINFSDPVPAVFGDDIPYGMEWLWRLTWHDGIGYAVIYGEQFALVRTVDGIHYETVTEIEADGQPNETTLRFTRDGRMAMMIRREKDGHGRYGWWGVSEAPYKDWSFTPMGFGLGGPEFTILDDDRVIMGTRSYFLDRKPKTILLKGGLDGVFEEMCVLPSGGDCSYPGFLIEGDELWVVYYSAHGLQPGSASIYLTRIPLKFFD
ncbi:MAG: hypothetical protein MJY50_02420 [Bacteroidales bacterium]|nr:hypothetical protein [Bacteroidales bacterium]